MEAPVGHYLSCIFHCSSTPHTLCLSLFSPGPSNVLLSYQQLHQQVDQHHPQVCFHAVKYTPPHVFKVCALNSPLAGGSCACQLRRCLLGCAWGGYLLAFSAQQCWINRVTGWKSIKDSADWRRAAWLYTSNNTIPRKRSVLKSLDLPIVASFALCWRSGTFLNTPQALCHQLTALNTYGTS